MAKSLYAALLLLLSSFCQAQFTHYSWIHDLKVRDEPSTDGKVLLRLKEGEGVDYANETSDKTAKITLRGKEYDAAWFKVKTQSGVVGWVHSAALTNKNPETKLYCWVADLRLRSRPDFESSTLAKLAEKEEVTFTGRRSEKKVKTKLREVEYNDYWLEIRTKTGVQGWSHGAGLKYLDDSYHNAANPVPLTLNTPQARADWWKKLSSAWKRYFLERQLGYEWEVSAETPVTDKQLVQILSLTEIDISANDGCATGPYYSSELTDLSGLSQLTHLTTIYAAYIQVSDFRPLHLLQSLKSLYLDETTYSSLDGLSDLVGLEALTIRLRNDEDFKKISTLSQLTQLYLSGTLSQLNALRYFPRLRSLYITTEGTLNLTGIEHCTDLYSLDMYCNEIVAETGGLLRSLKKLDNLSLSRASIDAKWLPTSLTRLWLWDGSIRNLSALSALTELEALRMDNGLRHLGELPRFPKLISLEILSPELESLDGLEEFRALESLQLGRVSMPSEKFLPLQDLPKLERFWLPAYLYDEDNSELRVLREAGIQVEFLYEEGGC